MAAGSQLTYRAAFQEDVKAPMTHSRSTSYRVGLAAVSVLIAALHGVVRASIAGMTIDCQMDNGQCRFIID
jgi:hypothetical protein